MLFRSGFALNDIKRLSMPLKRTGKDQWAGVKELPANSPRFMLPIPETLLKIEGKDTKIFEIAMSSWQKTVKTAICFQKLSQKRSEITSHDQEKNFLLYNYILKR